ncbi:MAG: response regulator [Acidobacteria bacterium]|nr:response regulator [Acidobacteriota bacterium]
MSSSAARHTFPSDLHAALAELFETTQLRGEGVTLGANPHLKLMFGFPPEVDKSEIRPFDGDRFVHPEARRTFVQRLTRDGAVADYLLRLRRADDKPIWVEVNAHLAVPGVPEPARVGALLRDVSERRKMEDHGRGVYHELLQYEKLAALGQTVSGVAHELNNPLATILTWSERLAGRSVDALTRRGIATILSESERAAKIVRNLLTFSRKHHTTRGKVDLNLVVRETLSLRTYDQRVSNITTIDALATGLPLVFADAHQLKQVLLNLVINAEQAMLSASGRGTLIVRTWHEAAGGYVVLEINDDGPGIPDDVRPRIFDAFFTTKSAGTGTGLGLTVASRIVEDHGGKLEMQSTPGHGASFYVQLPTSTGLPRPRATPVPREQPVVGRGSAVLLVEHEPALAEAVRDALKDAGFLVDGAPDGQTALEQARTRTYDLVICDLRMPRLDGQAFYQAVAGTVPSLTRRIVFVTGDVVTADAEAFLEESGCRWLRKPFRLADLLQVAREVSA